MITWTKRGAKILMGFFNGYGASWSALFAIANYQQWQVDLFSLCVFPIIGGLGSTWPQLVKVFSEISEEK